MRTPAVLVAALLVLGHDSAASLQQRPFSLAVLRRDGIAVPFAQFNGRRWQSTWPDTVASRDLPIALADVPKRWWGLDQPPDRMSLWSGPGKAREVRMTGLTTVKMMCEPRMAVRTDFTAAGALPSPLERPYPKEGLLIAGDASLAPVIQVEKGSADWMHIQAAITAEFDAEESLAAGSFADWRHPVAARDRKLVPVTIEGLYRAESDTPGWTAYFVEAVRQYPAGPSDKDGCGPLTFASGWVMVGPKNASRVRLTAKVAYCDRHAVNYMLPFGTVRVNGRIYWVFQFSGFDAEWYQVARPTPEGVDSHAAYHAGTCR